MFGQNLNYQSSRILIAGFGTLFNDFTVLRKDSGGNVIQSIKVPLIYGPKEAWVYQTEQNVNPGSVGDDPLVPTQYPVASVLPVISFEMDHISYDPKRKQQSTIQNVKVVQNDNTVLTTQYVPVPVVYHFNVFVTTKYETDAYQILEQIMPYFTPDFTIRIIDPSGLSITRDVPIVLNYPLSVDDNWDGDLKTKESSRRIVWHLSFDVSYYVFGQTKNKKEITEAQLRYFADAYIPNNVDTPGLIEVTTPNPSNATADDVFSWTETRV